MHPMDTLGARIRFARGKSSQDAFSALIGVSKGSLGGYERNENLPNTDVVLNICRQTNFSVEWLLTGQGPMRPDRQAAAAAAPDPTDMADSARLETAPSVCARCVRLEEKLDRLEEERRELNAENRRLWKENSELNARAARLEEQQKKTASAGFSERGCPAA